MTDTRIWAQDQPAAPADLKVPQGTPEVIPLNIIPIGHPGEKKITGNRFDPARAHYNRW